MAVACWWPDGAAFAAAHPGPGAGHMLADVAKWLGAPDGPGPRSATGSAADVRAAKSGPGHPHGRARGTGKGELSAWSPKSSKSKPSVSGRAHRGFVAKTSHRIAAKSGATFDYFQNADGTFTRHMWQARVNYRDSAGDWQPIDTSLGKSGDGRFHEKANSLHVSFAPGSANGAPPSASSPSARAKPASFDHTTVSASLVTPMSLPWRVSRAVQTDSAATGGSSGGPLATMTVSPSQSVSWSLAGANGVAASVSGSTAEYDGILTDTDLVLRTTADGVKESMVLHSASAPTSWVFPMSLTGLSLTTATDGTVELTDDSGAIVAALPQAYAYDSYVDPTSGEHHENWSVSYSVTTVNGSPAVQMSLDPNWLAGSSIQFPVTVDPTMIVSIAGQTQTTYVEYPYSEDFSSASVLKIGTYDGGAHIGEAYLKFPTLPNNDGYHITAASLAAFDIWADTCGSSSSYSVYPVTSSWSVTGSKSWPGPSTSSSIGTWSGTPSSTVCSNTSLNSSTGQWQYTTLSTSYFQDIALGKTTNNGIALFSSGTNNSGWKQFDSSQVSDHSPYLSLTYAANVAPDIEHMWPQSGYVSPTLTPELQVQAVDPDTWPNSSLTYDFAVYNSSGKLVTSSGFHSSMDWTVPSGKLAWSGTYSWTVSAYDGWSTKTSTAYSFAPTVAQPLVASRLAQNSGHGFDEEAGNYTTSAADADVAVVGPALKVQRSYNSLDVRTWGAFGAGWSSLADEKAVMDDDGSQNVVITDSSGKQSRYGYSASGYVPPQGTYATLTAVSGGGYSLLDTSGTTYTFNTAGGTNTWLLSKITTHAGLAETLSYNSSHQLYQIKNTTAQRSLFFTWSTPSGAAHPHVATVTTDDATSGNASTAILWTYGYTGDQLTSVCPPAQSAPATASTSCHGYSYTAGSDYPAAALDASPYSYWRLNDASGSTKAASSVLANEQTDAAQYANVTLGSAASPLSGSTASGATFNGSSSSVSLPGNLVTASSNQALSLWFKTSTAGVLFSYSASAVTSSSTSGDYTPALYVGTDGKLHGEFWYSGGTSPIVSSGSVANGAWHHVVLSAGGTSQSLYLDGALVGSASGQVELDALSGASHVYVGAGFWGGGWTDEPKASTSSNTGYADFFNGSIADVSFYTHPLTATQVTGLHTIGTTRAAYLTSATLPSGRTQAGVAYDTAASRVSSVTDEAGGTYTLGHPTVSGSSAVFRASVLGAAPTGYWRLADDSSATYAADEVNGDLGTYNDVTLGVTGPFASVDSTAATAASFNGTDSYVLMPSDVTVTTGPNTVAMWFKTTVAGGVLYGQEGDPISNATGNGYTPSLYVGTDGKLRAEFWINNISKEMSSGSAVNDGKWHYVVLSASTSQQTLYLDGSQQASLSATLVSGATGYTYIGAGGCAGAWAACPANSAGYFTGSIADVSFYASQLSAAQVGAQWSAYKASSGAVATETVTVTDPGQSTLTSQYDLSNGGRIISSTDGTGGTTSYGYDTSGFLHTVTDPNGDVTTTGHDTRGNTVSKTTCQDLSAGKCSTSYYTYYLNSSSQTDPRNDEVLTSSDGRSASSTDTTYRTSYTYDTNGNLLHTTTPALAGHSAGLTTNKTYTTSTTAGYVSGTTAPVGLLASTTTPGGAATSYVYYANGDLAQATSPLGLVTRYTYDQLGRVLTKTEISDSYPAGLVTSYTYDPLGRVLTELDPGTTYAVNQAIVHTALTTKTYDPDGNTLTSTVSDTTGGDTARSTSRTYNDFGELKTVTDPEQHTTAYTYDAYGNKATETDADGQAYAFTYDANGNRLTTTLTNYTGSSVSAQTAAAQLMEKRTYDAGGRLYTITDGIGVTTTYAYYDNGLTKQITRTGTSGTTFVDEQDSYDDAGNLTAKTTANGTLTTAYTVDAADRTTATATDPSTLARTTAYTFDDDSRVLTSTQTDAAGDPAQKWTYTRDAAGDVTSAAQYISSSLTLTTKATYDQRGLKVTSTDAQNQVTNYANDEAGRLTITTSPAIITTTPGTGATATENPTTINGYDTFGDRTAAEDAKGHITATAYDRDGRKTGTTLPSYNGTSATTAWTYNASGDVLTQTDAKGETDYAYDQLGDLVQQTNPAISISGTNTRGTITYAYDLAGDRLTETSPYGSVTHHTYDDLGRHSTTWAYVYTSTSAQTKQETDTAYDTAGRVASTTSISGVTAHYTYDALGRTHTAADTTGDTTTYTYDLRDDVIKTVLPDQSAQTATYDAAGRKTATANLDSAGNALSSTSATYTDNGELQATTDARQHTTSYEYDALGELTKQTEPVSDTGSITTKYGYDAAGHPTAYTDGNDDTTYYTYNSLGLPASKEVPAVTGYTSDADRTTSYTYDERGRLVTQSNPGGVTLTNTYDALDDLTTQTGTGADATTADRQFTYSLNGHLVASAIGGTWEYYNTNALGDILTTSGQAGSSTFTYNADESPATRTDASGTNTYTYDTDGRLNTDTDAATSTTLAYQYNSLSQPKSVTYGSAADVRNYGYDTLHHLTSDTLTTASGATVAKVAYDYDKNDNLTTKTTTGVQGASANTYAYDYANRLTSWTSGSTTTGYTYDADGNRLTAGSTTYTYNARDQLTSDGTLNYSYTARGTLAAKGSTAYTFDAYGQQVTAGATNYTYDALGRAITAGSTTLAYSGTDNTVASDGRSTYSRDPTGALTGESSATGATLAWTDLHTDVIGQFTAGGTALTGSASYDPWGTTTASTLTGNVGYQSEFTDTSTGNVNMHARWYSPGTGTFNSADTVDNPAVGDSANANHYAYANDTPLTGTDPSGHCFWDLCIGEAEGAYLLGAALISTCIAYCSALSNSISDAFSSSSSSSYSHAYTSSSAATHTSSYGMCAEVWSMSCQQRYGRTSSSDGGTSSGRGGGGGGGGGGGSTCYSCGDGGVSPAEVAAAAARAAAAAAAEAARRAAIRAHAIKITASIGKGTLAVHSISSAAEPPTVRINIGNSVRNAASAVAAGLTTAAVCVVTGGCSGDDDDRGKKKDSCNTGAGFTNPGIVYLPRHKQAGECVATGAFADLTQANYTPPPRPTLNFNLPGYDSLPTLNRARGHLVGFAMGGSNKDTRNFVPIFRTANDWMYKNVEGPVVKAIKNGGNVYVESYPIYGNKNSTVPTSINYFTSGSVQEECVIQNNATASGSYCQQGMW
jgi:RHS repeat-associated protein